ncbi:hypothetical protein K7432_003269 [Basidiobolus ranarum]|uniref:Glutathione S-transferase kappa n=1 Tax=Basidiobolus ranarum TaxID=34480 RepID=A0ABR2X078_9FUNG
MNSKSSTGKLIHYYFDYVSPYSYLALKNLQNLLRGSNHKLILKPVFLPNLLKHWKQSSPVANEAKRKWIIKDSYRHSSMNSIPFRFPSTHPFNSIYALRASVPAAVGDKQEELVNILFDSVWNPDSSLVDVTNKTELSSFLKENGFWQSSGSDEKIKQELEENTQEALKLEVFGVPSMVVDNQVFWGCDQLPYVMETLQGKDPLNHEEVKERCRVSLEALKNSS